MLFGFLQQVQQLAFFASVPAISLPFTTVLTAVAAIDKDLCGCLEQQHFGILVLHLQPHSS